MTVAARSLAVPLACPRCKGRVDVKSRHIAIAGPNVLVYCSAECLQARDTPPIETAPIAKPKRRAPWWIGGGIVVGAASLLLVELARSDDDQGESPMLASIPAASEAPAMPMIGGDDPRRIADDELLVELMHDAWLHPLAGPVRRMPISHNAAFGAVRAGERPPECLSGHCGVDLGNVWGEPVHAVHDGIVDNVNRGPNEEHGGIFVKIAHRNGTLFSWYFHLAAVPRWVRPGVKISAGQIIGLLGDTGVFRSEPHLHFAMSVKPTNSTVERYLDPEPLIAIWPLWIPKQTEGRLSTANEPGLPVRAPEHRKRSKHEPEPTPVESAPAAGDTPPGSEAN